MKKKAVRILIGAICAMAAGCVSTPTKDSASQGAGAIGGGLHNAGLVFFDADHATATLKLHRPNALTDPKEDDLIARCSTGGTGAQFAPLIGALLAQVVGELINVAADKIDTALQDALKNYTTTYSAFETVDLYSKVNPLTLSYSCFRFSRGDKDGVQHLDLIGQIQLAPDGDAIVLRPLRLYVDKLDTTSSSPDYSISFSIKADGLWRNKNEGKESVVFDKPFLTTKATLDGGKPTIQYYLDDKTKDVVVPIVAFSDPPPAGKAGFAMMTVTVVENGVPSKFLQALSKLFSGSKSSLEKSLTASADARLGLPAPSSNSGSTNTGSTSPSSSK